MAMSNALTRLHAERENLRPVEEQVVMMQQDLKKKIEAIKETQKQLKTVQDRLAAQIKEATEMRGKISAAKEAAKQAGSAVTEAASPFAESARGIVQQQTIDQLKAQVEALQTANALLGGTMGSDDNMGGLAPKTPTAVGGSQNGGAGGAAPATPLGSRAPSTPNERTLWTHLEWHRRDPRRCWKFS
eukprot:TRINITY_DN39853_c0_g1_i1.p1 TRINITY_DN39853_c0_g1~~TRINITY_DN39853_c0_g1_i1.p1  ORF type:complete len:216 (-),score=55.36 TRINITY_DN39853_c0_g1_i1:2-562(-)